MMKRQRPINAPLTILLRTVICILFATLGSQKGNGLIVVYAQSPTATLGGIVIDEHGAAISGVNILITKTDNAMRRQVATESNGRFLVPLLPPGNYLLQVQGQGFATLEVKDVILNINDHLSLTLQLTVGKLSESITVEGEPLIQSESAVVDTLIDRQFVENLPLNGRSFQTLIELTPGVVLTVSNASEQGQFSVNGQRANANYFTVDGAGANIGISPFPSLGQTAGGTIPAFTVLGGTNNLVSVDALQEFRVQTSTYDPEFGRTPGAQISIATRSGTNTFHGNLFDYFRNDALDANDWFANSRGLRKPPLRQNDFGGTLGGPILKDRTFFFFSYEGLRLRQPQVAITRVPSLEARRLAPATIKPIFQAFPVPNGKDLGTDLTEYDASYANPSSLDAASVRIDHTVSSMLSLFGRYNHAPSEGSGRGGEGILNDRASVFVEAFKTQTLTLGATQTFSSNVSNDFRINYSKTKGASFTRFDNFGGATPPPDSALFPPFATSQDSDFIFIAIPLGFAVGKNVDNHQHQWNIVDSASVFTGSHQIKFGLDFRRLSPIFDVLKYGQEVFFNDLNQAITGNTFFTIVFASPNRLFPIFNNFSVYGQDTWKVSQRLTFTYGLRWEVNPPPSEKNDNTPYTVIGLENPATMTLAPKGTPLWKTTYNNFAPRIGLAYRASQSAGRETVIRGGAGVFYDLGTGPIGTAYAQSSFGYFASKFLFAAPFPLSPEAAATPVPDLSPPYGGLVITDPRLKLPRVYQWSAAVEQSLGAKQVFSATYVGAIGRKLLRGEILSQPNPNFDGLLVARNRATSDYHALQLQFERRLRSGLQALASYTWSHSIDISSNESFSAVSTTKLDPRMDRGPSDFDVRHSMSAAITYDIPGVSFREFFHQLTRDWSVDAIFRARSSTPVNVLAQAAPLFGVARVVRPDLIPGVPLYLDDSTVAGGRRINSAAFSTPPPSRQGNLGRNALRGFASNQLDLSLRRQFILHEGIRIQLRSDFFNIFNHPNFGNPVNTLGDPLFGQSLMMQGASLGGLSTLYQIGGPRSTQLSLKLLF